ncbi:MAG TPA: AAA family ATPase, partial [Pirellula sp.]|nr:AAA family ATPase [Pirellula sp.]
MLKKILGIANIGRFGCYSPTGDLEFCKLTLIFGENGRGKSTITSIIRSLQSGDGNHISERETLPIGIASPAVKVRLQTGSCEFKRGSWSSSLPDIEIFDAQFINDNVFSGLSVDHEHKRNLYRIIVGEQGVLLSQKVDVLDGKIRAINTELSEKKGEIKLHVEDS